MIIGIAYVDLISEQKLKYFIQLLRMEKSRQEGKAWACHTSTLTAASHPGGRAAVL